MNQASVGTMTCWCSGSSYTLYISIISDSLSPIEAGQSLHDTVVGNLVSKCPELIHLAIYVDTWATSLIITTYIIYMKCLLMKLQKTSKTPA